MTRTALPPSAIGQLVWSPIDPSLGVGIVRHLEHRRVKVRFLSLENERIYTTGDQVIMRYRIEPGESVRDVEGEECLVLAAVDGAGEKPGELFTYELDDGREVLESDLVPDVRDIGAKARLASLDLVHPNIVRARMQGMALATMWPRPGTAALLGARAYWLPHQIDVATRAMQAEPVRMLLADEVGLGKTVEAALIFAGLRYEGRAERVLVLTPKALCIQWLGELFRKTHELLVLMDEDRIEDALAENPDLNPFESHQRIVASIDKVAADPTLAEEASEAPWDLVIVDEAHHLRWNAKDGGNASYRLVEALAKNSRHLLLLTATPMALDPAEYHALLRLLDRERFDDPKEFEEIHEHVAAIRESARALAEAAESGDEVDPEMAAQIADILADDDEDSERWQDFVDLGAKSKKRPAEAEAILNALRARHGIADFVVRNRRGPVGGMPEREPQTFPLEPSELQAQLNEIGEEVMVELADTLEDEGERARTLGTLLRALWATPRALLDILMPLSPALGQQLAPAVAKLLAAPLDEDGLPTGDVRLRWLVDYLRRLDPKEKVLLFVESDIAVRALKDALDDCWGNDLAVFHKGLAPSDQDRQVAWFRSAEGPSLMLSTEAGGEGRNFQFCSKVILYDMPWRPATVEQRIGRVDRVGQKNNVEVLVPHFQSGYEAAIVKVMQQSIGVLDETVGGIDHELEYVSTRLANLILDGGGFEDWKQLYVDTRRLVVSTRERIANAVDPILDHASFSPERVAATLDRVPEDLEAQVEEFVRGYAEHNRLEIHTKRGKVVGIEGAPGAAGGDNTDTAYNATFCRTYAIDHEGVEFLSFGHPLVEQAMEWAEGARESSAALALCRGYSRDGALFLWRFGLEFAADVPEAGAYFREHLFTFALDEAGKRVPEFENLFDDNERELDKMDASPLKAAMGQWQGLVEKNYEGAEAMVDGALAEAVAQAKKRARTAFAERRREIERGFNRREFRVMERGGDDAQALVAVDKGRGKAMADLDAREQRVMRAIEGAKPSLLGAMAVRLVKQRMVSG